MCGVGVLPLSHATNGVMAGLVPAIHELDECTMAAAFVYFMTNKPNGTLYVG
jgi:hypothetical protein